MIELFFNGECSVSWKAEAMDKLIGFSIEHR